MKNLLILVSFCFVQIVFSQVENDCDNINKPSCCPSIEDGYSPKIPAWEDVGCKTAYKETEYLMFPKILEYKGYIFKQLTSCAVQNMDCILTIDYCLQKTRQNLRVEIKDYKDPFFESKMGIASKNIDLIVFQPGAVGLGSHSLSPLNKKYKNSVIVSSRFSPYGGEEDSVSYIAYVNERYLIHIIIDDKPKYFTEAIQVEKFLKEYISQINLVEK
ncbi:hypothetical protein FLGE108171_03970 [Flavobacterium gelidilacus]|uniref:hypothetical protein n=1 Tax=Flavobacterium gelidilacus TaxID=206041 RepID=UPI00042500E0|nr:hypothetical protein [Flavobacterium gelidilacus]